MSDDEAQHDETTETPDEGMIEAPDGPLAAKIAKAMGGIDDVPKRGKVKYSGTTKYEYATADDLISAAQDALASVGVAIFPSVTDEIWKDKGKSAVQMTIKYTVVDGDSGDTMVCRWRTDGVDSGDKARWKALTQGHKYFLRKLLNIPTGEKSLDAEFGNKGSGASDETNGGPSTRSQPHNRRSGGRNSGNGGGQSYDHGTQSNRLHALLGEVELADNKKGELRDVLRLKACGSTDVEWSDVPASGIAKWCDRLEQLDTDAQSNGPPERAQKVLSVVNRHDVNRDATE